METKLTKVENLKKDDIILDSEGIELIVKKIEKIGKRFSVTVNYVEEGIYRMNDVVKIKNASSLCYKVQQ